MLGPFPTKVFPKRTSPTRLSPCRRAEGGSLMARTRLVLLCLVVIGLIGACPALWGQAPRFAYVANCGASCGGVGSGDVSAYAIDATTGALASVPGSPFAAGMGPRSVAVGPSGQFAYVANAASNDVSAYTIDAMTGALTPVAGSPFPAGSFPIAVAVDSSGQFAYVANGGSNNVSAYTIDPATGALAEISGSPFAAGSLPFSVTTR